ncbi:metA-pathway of phenol degradation family protein [Acinetobacter baumannii 1437282]|nr:metA-pathway of phenol degradation family protein [Acinetobacter baumannii 1437282]
MTVLALSLSAITSTLYAAEPQPPVSAEADQAAPVTEAQANTATESTEAPVADTGQVTENSQADQAASALQKKESDATQETNLQEVFTSNERQYSLIKKGVFSSYYDLDYTYYRDSRLDLAMNDSNSSLSRLRVEEDANHTLTNTFTVQYGLLDNLTLSASVPFVAKKDLLQDQTTAGLGDINFGARWEPFPLKQGRLPLVLFGSLSTKTGDSPYEVGIDELSTGKGYYSVGAGASTRKYIDPVVLFASVSTSYGLKESGLNQLRGSRVLESFDPGLSGGFSFGFAYSFNYDVSLTMSYQQSFNTGAKFYFENDESYKSADQSSAMLSFALGVRVSPETIVNGTVGIGLTEDAPDVSLGLSFPLDIIGFGKKIR